MQRREFIGLTLATGGTLLGTQQPAIAQTVLVPPPMAAKAGFTTLVFQDEFDVWPDIGFGENGHQWQAGLWWEQVPNPLSFKQFGTTLTIMGGPSQPVNLCTQDHVIPAGATSAGGTQFLGGYFEARMQCWDWSAFWLFCWDRPWVWASKVDPNNPMTWTNEIDIVETDPGFYNSVWHTLHRNSSGDSLPDQQNSPVEFDTNTGIVGYWHNYGLLWTQNKLTWFVDEIPVLSLPPYPSTWQPTQLVLTAAPGGVNGSPSKTPIPVTKVDWVHVWH